MTIVNLIAQNGKVFPGEPSEKANFQEPYVAGIANFLGASVVRTIALQDIQLPEVEANLRAKQEEASELRSAG